MRWVCHWVRWCHLPHSCFLIKTLSRAHNGTGPSNFVCLTLPPIKPRYGYHLVPSRILQVGANPEYARFFDIWQPMSGNIALLLQNTQKSTILRCLYQKHFGIFGADTYFGYSGGYQMISLSRFYRCLGLLEFFNILKFLGQKN